MKLNCIHADTCLPDFWGGHHLPHIQISVDPHMTIVDVRRAIKAELRMGCVMGSSDDARLLSHDVIRPEEEKRADALTRAVYDAVDRDVRLKRNASRRPFRAIEVSEDGDSVYAYFVFMEAQ